MAHLSEGLQFHGGDLISGNLEAIQSQVYIAAHYDGENNLSNPSGILNPRGRRLLGIFSSFKTADIAIRRVSNENGFKDNTEKFAISCFCIDQSWWNCGFSK
jgi:hypothetical protein